MTQTAPEPPIPRQAERIDAPRRSAWGFWLIAALLVAGGIAATSSMKGRNRLNLAQEAAAEYGLVEGVPPSTGIDLAPWGAKAKDWFQRHEPDGLNAGSIGDLSAAGVGELLVLGQELAALSTASGDDWASLAHDEKERITLLPAFHVGNGLLCIAAGKAPPHSEAERLLALEATIHLADALSRRHVAGLMIASVLIDEAWTAFQASQASGLALSPAQRSRLRAALERLDLDRAAVRGHANSVAVLLEAHHQTPWWSRKGGPLRGAIGRFDGRAATDEAFALELAVLTQEHWREEDGAALAKHAAAIRGMMFSDYPLATRIGVELHQRLDKALVAKGNLLAWQAELGR